MKAMDIFALLLYSIFKEGTIQFIYIYIYIEKIKRLKTILLYCELIMVALQFLYSHYL